MNSWKVILATIVIFGTGLVTGGLLVPQVAHFRGHESFRGAPASHVSAGGLKFEFLRRVQRDLNLSPEQQERIDKILSQGQERTLRLMDPVRSQLQAEVKRAKEEFLEVLTPEQRSRFEEIWKQQHRQHEQREQREQRHSQPPRERPAQNAPAPASTNS
jgi:hypothetical protein